MPGFFSANSAHKLSSWSHYYVDWSRVGELLRAGKHHYSYYELLQRGIIVTITGYSGYVGFRHRQDNVSAGLYSMAGCFVGFVVSHLLVIAPLVYKRYQISQNCSTLQINLLQLLQDLSSCLHEKGLTNHLTDCLARHVSAFITFNVSTEKQVKASQTWGARQAVLTAMTLKLNEDLCLLKKATEPQSVLKELEEFWLQDNVSLYLKLRGLEPLEEVNPGKGMLK